MSELLEAWGDVVDALDLRSNEWQLINGAMGYGTVHDRRDGRNIPIFQHDQDLAQIRATCRLIADLIPTAQGVLKGLKNYILHTGMTYRVLPEDGVSIDPKCLRAAQRVVDKFLDAHNWTGGLEEELFNRSRIDGESFLEFSPQNDGTMQVRTLEPEQVRDPGQTEEGRSFSFGLDSPADDVWRVDHYWVEDFDGQFRRVPAEEVCHQKLNVVRSIKRGLSDFYSVRGHLVDSEKLNRNTRLGAAIAAAIAYVREHAAGTTSAQASTFQSSKATSTFRRQTATGTTTGYTRRFEPGTIVDVPAGLKYLASPLATIKADVMSNIEQSVLRKVGVRWNMPEHIVSGLGTGASYASEVVHESPWVRECESEQIKYIKHFRSIVWKVLQHAADCGAFKQWGLAGRFDLEDALDLAVTAPSVVTRNRLQEAQADDLEEAAGILSKRTRAGKAGYDLDEETKLGAKVAAPPQQPGMPGAEVPSAIGSGAGAAAKPATAAAAVPPGEEVASQVLNGAQIQAAAAIIATVAAGTTPRDSGVSQLKIFFNLSQEQAEEMIGTAGQGIPTAPNPGAEKVPPKLPGAAP